MRLAGLLALLGLVPLETARATEREPAAARFAVIVGVNQAIDSDTLPLRYADDDAARYLDLFRALGARTYVLSRFDVNTRRVHPQAVAEAQEPRRRELEAVLAEVTRDVARARQRGVATVLYFIYAGHGKVESGRGYVGLEDGRLYGSDLERLVVDGVRAGKTHIIVDACYSAFLAFSRGPGGERRDAHGFAIGGGLGSRPDVGLLLSTSTARESHEWSEYQAGIFSHEVRSGLLGAADADTDGQVSYREIAAFIDRANASIPNERYRPDVYVKPPTSERNILDLRPGLTRRLELSGEHPGHYMVEDARGVRLADFHNAPGQSLRLIRPPISERMFLRRVGDGVEYVMDTAEPVLRFEGLPSRTATVSTRGAAHESFRKLFALAYSKDVVDAFVLRTPAAAPTIRDTAAESSFRRAAGYGLLGLGTAAGAGALWSVLSAKTIQRRSPANQMDLAEDNGRIGTRNTWARRLFGAGAAALVGGALLLWTTPDGGEQLHLDVTLGPGEAALGLLGRF